MYKDVAKRVLAVILTFCMVGSMPDFTLFAAGVGSEYADVAADVQNGKEEQDNKKDAIVENEDDSEMAEEAGSEAEPGTDAEHEEDALDIKTPVYHPQSALSPDAARNASGKRGAEARNISLSTAPESDFEGSTVNGTLPNQVEADFPVTGAGTESFVSEKVLGLKIFYKNTELNQILTESAAGDGYKVYYTRVANENTVTLILKGSGIYEEPNSFRSYSNVRLGKDIRNCTVDLSYAGQSKNREYYYEGRALALTITVKDGDATVSASHYTIPELTEEFDWGVGDKSITIRGTGEYAGEKAETFKIIPTSVGVLYEVIGYDKETVYNKAKAQSPVGVFPTNFQIRKKDTFGGGQVSGSYESLDYNAGNSRNTDRVSNPPYSMAHVDIVGRNNCEGQIPLEYSIVPADFGNEDKSDENYIYIDVTSKHSYNGDKQRPEIRVYQKDAEGTEVELEQGTEYTIDPVGDNQNVLAGTGKITVRAAAGSNFTGEREVSFTIDKYDISSGDFEDAIKRNLELEQEYSSDNPCYKNGKIEPSVPDTINMSGIIIGSLEKNTDFTVSYENNYGVGNGIISIEGKGNCKGSVAIGFVIWKYITDTDDGITISVENQQYTGKDIKPSPVIKNNGKLLNPGTDYEVVDPGVEWIDCGSYTVKVRGKGDFYRNESVDSYLTASFRIVPRKLNTLKAEFVDPVKNNTFTFNGSGFKKGIKVVDESGKIQFPLSDFDITYRDATAPFAESECKNAGEYQVRIEPKIKAGGFEVYEAEDGEDYYITLPFTIQPKALEENDEAFSMKLSLNGADLTSTPYTGEDITADVTVLDKHRGANGEYSQASVSGYEIKKSAGYPGDDYEISYSANRRDVGRVTVTVTGKGNYTGTLKKPFQIVRKTLTASDINITIAEDTYTYTGDEVIPEITEFKVGNRVLTQKEIEREFTIESGAVNAQKAGDERYTFTITGKNNYSGTINSKDIQDAEGNGITFTIVPQDINDSNVWVEPIPNQAYDENQPAEPVPVIRYNGRELEFGEGKDFTLTWERNDNKDAGITDPEQMPVVIITGSGNFTGVRKEIFHIRESIMNADVQWDALVFQYISRELKPGPVSVMLDGEVLAPETILRDENGNLMLDSDGNYIVDGDYKVSWKNNIDAAGENDPQEERPTIIISGINDYGGEIRTYFTIEPVLITLESWTHNNEVAVLQAPLVYTPGNNPMFTGSPVIPSLSIIYNVQDPITGESFQYKLVEGKDYDVFSVKGTNAGQKTDLTIIPKDNFIPPAEIGIVQLGNYTVDPKSISSSEIRVSDIKVEAPVTKFPVKPEIVVTDTKRQGAGSATEGEYVESEGTYQLKESKDNGQTGDYRLIYGNNDSPGSAYVIIQGVNNYSGTITKYFTIPGDLRNADVSFLNSTCGSASSGEYYYTGYEITPQIMVTTTVAMEDGSAETKTLIEGVDYEVEFAGDRVNCGSPEIRLSGIGAYGGDGSMRIEPFTIVPVDIKDADLFIAPSVEYIGNGINVWPGGNEYDGTEKNEAAENSLRALSIKLGRYVLQEGVDYVLEHESSCWQPSAATTPAKKYILTIKPGSGGNFTGAPIEQEYTIGNNFNVKIQFRGKDGKLTDNYTAVYTEEAIEPEIVVTDQAPGNTFGNVLVEGEDYSVTFADNINAGTVTVMVCGLAGQDGKNTTYCGIRTTAFTIEGMNLSDTSQILIEDITEEYTYTSKEIKPEPKVTWKDHRDLEPGVDFDYVYRDNINVGDGYGRVTITAVSGNGNFISKTERAPVQFVMNPKNITDQDVILDSIPDQIYVDEEIEPALNIHWGADDIVLNNPTDYTQTYGERGNKNVGTVDMQVKGTGNYTGTIDTAFRIVPVKISDIILEYGDQNPRYDEGKYPWTGKQIKPQVKLTYYGTDGQLRTKTPEVLGCTVSYGPNQIVGTTTGTITLSADPNGNCEGDDAVWRFGIVKRHIDDPEIEMTGVKDEYKLNKDMPECKPVPVLTFTPDLETRYTMRLNEDYSLDYQNYDQAGTATLTVTGEKNFDNEIVKNYIIANDLKDYVDVAEIDPSELPLVYNGKVQHPKLNLEFATNTIKEGETYTIGWDGECINAGEYKVLIQAVPGSGYTGTIEIPFTIEKCPIGEITFTIEDQEYIGSAIIPEITDIKAVDERISEEELGEGVYEVTEYGDNLEVGDEGTVTVKALEESNYTGEADVTFAIVPADLEKEYMESSVIDPQEYTGSDIVPELLIKDTRRNQDGEAKAPEDTESYLLGSDDYDIEIIDNKYPGRATVTITGKNHYKGIITKFFDITADLSFADIAPIPAQKYTGEEVKPKLSVKLGEKELIEDTDFYVTYDNNIERGRASATIHPMPLTSYTGEKTAYFDISRDISGAEIQLIDSVFTYTGGEIRPVAAVVFEGLKLTPGTDYKVDYANNVNVGTAEITVTGIGGYDGSITMTFEIGKRSVVQCSYDNVENKIYTGTPTSQDLAVTYGGRALVLNQDYQISYEDNAAPGLASLIVSGIGNYGGVKTIRYLVNMTNVSGLKAKGSGDYVQLSWTAVPGAEGYTVYDANNQVIARTATPSYKNTGLTAMTTYTYKIRPYASSGGSTYYGSFSGTVRATTSIARPVVKLKGAKKKITVSWKKIDGVDGYEIYRSTKKTKGYKKIRTAKKSRITSYTNKRLTSKQKYFYRIRAYKKVNGKKIYSSYSSPKSVKAK